jgi:hypothetical protein
LEFFIKNNIVILAFFETMWLNYDCCLENKSIFVLVFFCFFSILTIKWIEHQWCNKMGKHLNFLPPWSSMKSFYFTALSIHKLWSAQTSPNLRFCFIIRALCRTLVLNRNLNLLPPEAQWKFSISLLYRFINFKLPKPVQILDSVS